MIKNFLYLLKRYKTSSALNMLGLSIAYAAFILIMMQVEYDYRFDTFHDHCNKIYRIDRVQSGSKMAVISRPMAETLFGSSPHIVAGALTSTRKWELLVNVEKNGSKFASTEQAKQATPDVVRVFPFDILEGSETALEDPSGALIPQSLAYKLFGRGSAIGKKIGETHYVRGIYRDFPANSSIENCIYFSLGYDNVEEWGNWNYYAYVRLDNADATDVRATINRAAEKMWTERDMREVGMSEGHFAMTSLPALHFATDVQWDYLPKASWQTLFTLFSIAIAIVLMAGINFMNFSMALVPRRIRSVNTQKVMGASASRLRALLVSEAVFISLSAFGWAVVFVYIASQTPVAGLLDAGITLSDCPWLLTMTALVAVATGVLSGVYPAYYITSFQPAIVLKGAFGLSPQGKRLRNLLIGIQFVSSFALTMAALFMYVQNNYLQSVPLGFNRDEIIVTDVSRTLKQHYDVFRNDLKSFAGIEEVAYGNQRMLGSTDTYMSWGREYEGRYVKFQCMPVSASFLRVMGIKINEGRDFRDDDELAPHHKYVFNEQAQKAYDLQLNTYIDSTEIVGFFRDIHFTTLHTAPVPMAFLVYGVQPTDNTRHAYIKVKSGSDRRAAMRHVQSVLSRIDTEWAFNVHFYDEAIQSVYEKEKHLTLLIGLFSAIAILISVIGVFGLVVFETAYRRKEISIRKVHGSSIREILLLFDKTYLLLLGICFLTACPIVYYAVDKWLENFMYKTPIYGWVFLLGGTIVSAITLLTVSAQSYKAACANPTKALNSD